MSNNTPATTHVVGTLRSVDGAGVVRMEERYDTGIDDLWSALTDPQRLARWIAEVEGDLRIGGEFQASFTSGWQGPGRVDACEPPRRLLVTMTPGQADETVIEAELTAEGDQTFLVVEERGLPLNELAAHGAGWQAHVEDLAALSPDDSELIGARDGPSSHPPTASAPMTWPEPHRAQSYAREQTFHCCPVSMAHTNNVRQVKAGVPGSWLRLSWTQW